MKLILAIFCSSLAMDASTKTVCSSGCDYADLQSAITATQADCTITALSLTAGQTFTTAGTFQMLARPCANLLTIQSSAIAQFPPVGYRVTPSNFNYASLMPIVTTSNVNDTVLQIAGLTNGSVGYQITAANTTAHTLTLNNTAANISQLAVGTAMVCRDYGNGFSSGSGINPTLNPQPGLPQPLQRFTQYFISSLTSVDSNDVAVQFALTPGGSPISISTTDGINNPSTDPYLQPSCALWNNAQNVTFRGIFFKAPDSNVTGTATASGTTLTAVTGGFSNALVYPGLEYDHQLLYNGQAFTMSTATGCTGGSNCTTATVVENAGDVSTATPFVLYGNYPGPIVAIGGQEYDLRSKPSNITFEQCFFGGDPNWRDRSVQTAMLINGRDVMVQDSWLESMYLNNGNEGKCFAVVTGNGMWLNNNECDSAGAFMLTGGQIGDIPLANAGNIHISNNYLLIPGWMQYTDSGIFGSTTPPSSCYYEGGSGGQFVNRTDPVTLAGGSVFTCQPSGTFSADTGAIYRPTAYRYKSKIEFKDVSGLEITGNVVRGSFTGQDSNDGVFVLTHTEQSEFDNTGRSYYTHANAVVKNNWFDRVWSGILVGQVAPSVAITPVNISAITVASASEYDVTTSPAYPTALFEGCPCPFFIGISGSGNTSALNGRFTYVSSMPDNTHLHLEMNTTGAQYQATGSYTSGGSMTSVTWPTSQNITVENNLITRLGEQQLSLYPSGASPGISRPLRIYYSHLGGPVVDHLTMRQDSTGTANYAVSFETNLANGGVAFASFPYSQAQLTNSMLDAQAGSYLVGGGINTDCTNTGLGGWFGSAAAFSHDLLTGAGAGWPNPGSGCSDQTNLKTAANDAAVSYAGSDQSMIANSVLSSTSAYSALSSSPVMLSTDGTDLGADVLAVQMATSGTIAGTPPWHVLAGLRFDVGSTGLIANVQGPASWTITLYNAPARIPANQAAQVADSCGACILDRQRRQIVVGGLAAATAYYYSATDGARVLVGQIQTSPAGAGTYSFNASGMGVRYSASANMSSATASSSGAIPVPSGAVRYVDHGAGTAVVAMIAR